MTPLSVVIISFNEEAYIGRCLSSVEGIAEDIIVVDSFSTDRTAEICRARGARVVQEAFRGHIAQKNLAITLAKFPHILSLDADEWLSVPLREEIQAIKSNWDSDGYTLNRLNRYCGQWIRHGDWYPDRKLRLWDSRKGSWGGDNPHDRFILQQGSRVGNLKADLLHEAYDNLSEHLKKVDSYSTISARALFGRGGRTSRVKLALSPPAAFIRSYILRQGWRDGWYGFVIAGMISYGTFLKYVRLRELWMAEKKDRA